MSITVTNRFQTSQYLQRLPEEFSTFKVKTESLQTHVLRRICRYIEYQFGKSEAKLISNREIYIEHIKYLLEEEFMDTKDITEFLVVLGNRKGMLSMEDFHIKDSTKDMIDQKQFDDNYPIFIDDSVSKFLQENINSPQIEKFIKDNENSFKEENVFCSSTTEPNGNENSLKEENIFCSSSTEPNENEIISKLQAALAQKEIDFDNEVAYWMAKCFSLEDEIHKLAYDKSQIIRVTIQAIRSDRNAFKLIKARMIKAIPNELLPVFERKTKTVFQLSTLYRKFEVILKMMDQFPETRKFKTDYNGANLNAMKQQKKFYWHKYVNCYYCGQKGHIKKYCFKRGSKSTKSRLSGMDKKSP